MLPRIDHVNRSLRRALASYIIRVNRDYAPARFDSHVDAQ